MPPSPRHASSLVSHEPAGRPRTPDVGRAPSTRAVGDLRSRWRTPCPARPRARRRRSTRARDCGSEPRSASRSSRRPGADRQARMRQRGSLARSGRAAVERTEHPGQLAIDPTHLRSPPRQVPAEIPRAGPRGCHHPSLVQHAIMRCLTAHTIHSLRPGTSGCGARRPPRRRRAARRPRAPDRSAAGRSSAGPPRSARRAAP